jgi:hypothetical protein
MSALTVITSLMPVIKAAAETIASFTGDDNAARTDSTITNAFDVIGAIVPLIDTFASGGDVTSEDAREALDGFDQALADFDAEIARQGG